MKKTIYRDYTLENIVANAMSKRRYQHVCRVVDFSLMLADFYQVDQKKAYLAAIVHDYAKERSIDDLFNAIDKFNLDQSLKQWNSEILHGIVGAELIRTELNIQDEEILDAVREHTIAGLNMTMLSKILFMADFLELGRNFPNVWNYRELVFTDLDAAVASQLHNTLKFLVNKKEKIFPQSVINYNYWVSKLGIK